MQYLKVHCCLQASRSIWSATMHQQNSFEKVCPCCFAEPFSDYLGSALEQVDAGGPSRSCRTDCCTSDAAAIHVSEEDRSYLGRYCDLVAHQHFKKVGGWPRPRRSRSRGRAAARYAALQLKSRAAAGRAARAAASPVIWILLGA